jgi:hypothetical protein
MADKRVGHLRHYKAEELVSEFTQQGFDVKSVTYSAHLYKALQIFLGKLIRRIERPNSRVWWMLEKLDIQMDRVPSGLQLHLVMKKREVGRGQTETRTSEELPANVYGSLRPVSEP